MTSIQDVANAAYLLGDQAKALAQQSLMCAETVERHSSRLYAIVRGSASRLCDEDADARFSGTNLY